MLKKVAVVALGATSAQAAFSNTAKTGDGSTCDPTCMSWQACYESRCMRVSSPCTYFFGLAEGTDFKLDADCDYSTQKCVPDLTVKNAARPHLCMAQSDMAICDPVCGSGKVCKLGACVTELAEMTKLSADAKEELYKTALDTSTFDKIRTIKRSGTRTDDSTSEETVTDDSAVTLVDNEVLRVDPTAGKVARLQIPDALSGGGAVLVDENTDFEVATELKVEGDKAAMTVGKGSKTLVEKFTVAAGKSFEMQFGDKAKTTELKNVDLADKASKLSLSGGKVSVDVLDKASAGTSKGTLQLSGETELSGNTGKYVIEVVEHVGAAARAEVGNLETEGDIVGDGELSIKGTGKKLKMTGAVARVAPKIVVEAGGEFQSTSDDFTADKVAIKGKFAVKDNSVGDEGKNVVQNIEECPAGGQVILEVSDVSDFTDQKSKTVFKYDSAANDASKRAAFKCSVRVKSATAEKTANVVTAFDADLNIGAKYQNRRLLQTNDCVQAVWGENSLEVAAAPCPEHDAATTTAVSALSVAAVFAAMF